MTDTLDEIMLFKEKLVWNIPQEYLFWTVGFGLTLFMVLNVWLAVFVLLLLVGLLSWIHKDDSQALSLFFSNFKYQAEIKACTYDEYILIIKEDC